MGLAVRLGVTVGTPVVGSVDGVEGGRVCGAATQAATTIDATPSRIAGVRLVPLNVGCTRMAPLTPS